MNQLEIMGKLGPPCEPVTHSVRMSDPDIREQQIRRKYRALSPAMDERMRRLWAGSEAEAYGEGGITAVERATGLSRTTIRAGRDELRCGIERAGLIHVRRAGGGRPRLEEKDPGLAPALESLVEPVARGDFESPLRWTSKSTRALAEKLAQQGRTVSPQKIAQLLQSLGYTLQSTRRTAQERTPMLSQRSARFRRVCELVERYLERGITVLSVATVTTRKVLSAGPGESLAFPAPAVSVTDPVLGQAIPCRVFDLSTRTPEPPVEIGLDVARFTVDAVARWWQGTSSRAPARPRELFLAVGDGAPFRPSTLRAELQGLAHRTGLAIVACHLPPGTVKWNRIEERLVCRIAAVRRGGPMIEHETTVELIGPARARPRRHGDDDDSGPALPRDEEWCYAVSSGGT